MDFQNEATMSEAPAEIKAPENVVLGLVGALVGAVLGGASIVLLSQMGYVASISGLILAVATLKGYELLGRNLSKTGVVLCVILMIVTPFLADWIDWSIILMAEYEVSFAEAFAAFGEMLFGGYVIMSEYLKNLGMIYLFVVLGAYGTLKSVLKK